jgi:hypothetical protein
MHPSWLTSREFMVPMVKQRCLFAFGSNWRQLILKADRLWDVSRHTAPEASVWSCDRKDLAIPQSGEPGSRVGWDHFVGWACQDEDPETLPISCIQRRPPQRNSHGSMQGHVWRVEGPKNTSLSCGVDVSTLVAEDQWGANDTLQNFTFNTLPQFSLSHALAARQGFCRH